MGKFTNLRVALVLGGESTEQQFQEVTDNPDILVATPGRLQHVLVMMEADYNPLKCVEYLVFDEADRFEFILLIFFSIGVDILLCFLFYFFDFFY